jgi:hypothetical protein
MSALAASEPVDYRMSGSLSSHDTKFAGGDPDQGPDGHVAWKVVPEVDP